MENDLDVVLNNINAELAGLHAQSKFLNEVIDRLHTENERLRAAESQRNVAPALRELIKLADDWRSRAASLKDETDPAQLCGEIVEDVTLLLERQGVEEFSAVVGAEFDRTEQRAVKTQPTDDSAQDGLIAEARRPGYRADGRVIRFAEVEVLKFTPPLEP